MESKQIIKPTSAFQYYLKNWKNLSDEEKAPFELMAQRDKNRYNDEIKIINVEEESKVMEKEIYLKAYTGGYSCSGLDNGARSYEIIGPVVKILEYSEDESNDLDVKVKEYHYRDKNNTKHILYHNQKYKMIHGGNPVYTYSKTYSKKRDRPYNPIKTFYVLKEKPEYVGCITYHYTSFNDDTWTTYH
tara:strand:- start:2013 stop:2576 length:564 start_codon:yes stop_codon:yes gene_type:complete